VLVTWLFLLPKAARRQLPAWQCVAAFWTRTAAGSKPRIFRRVTR
jgi:hypothetical protein